MRSTVLLAVAMASFVSVPVHGERVSTARLLPETTVAFVRVADVPQLRQQFGQTSMGRILADEQIQPFVGHLYGSLLSAYERIQTQVGASLDDLLSVPQGELSFALVLPRGQRPQAILLVEVGEQRELAETLLAQLDDQMIARGLGRTVESHGETEVLVYQSPGDRQRELAVFVRDSTILFTTSGGLSQDLLSVWEGAEDYRCLADNRKFATIMHRCRGERNERADLVWYVDPIEIVTNLARGNLSGQAGVATLKGLGADGLKGLGGAVFLNTAEFEVVSRAQVLLAMPREGVVRMVSFGSGDLTPEPWVPTDVASYTSWYWNADETYDELERLYDIFRGEGAWQSEMVARLVRQLGINIEEEVLTAIEGRITLLSWMEKPARLNSQARLLAVKLNDAESFRGTLKRVVEQFPALVTASNNAGISYYQIEAQRENQQPNEALTRIPRPCAAVIGDYFLLTDSEKLLHEAIRTKGDASLSLDGELDFKLIYNKIQRQVGKEKAAMIAFQRPEEEFRQLYDLANQPALRDRLTTIEHPVLKALNAALREHPLPPFSVLARYLAPGGAVLVQDETGLHYTSFGLRRD